MHMAFVKPFSVHLDEAYKMFSSSYTVLVTGNEALMAEMSERALKAAKPGASADIAQHILSLVESSVSKTSNKIC